jgi:predicted SPOUT superfamily RNA methylase MTH1
LKKRRNSISIALPASMVSEQSDLREKTGVLAQVGRAAAIYRVDEIIIYPDKPDESLLMKYILGYMETPQYLRKYLFKVRPELRYAGTLPPLRTIHHPIDGTVAQLKIGEAREGVVTDATSEGILVDIGVDQLLEARGRGPSRGSRVTVRVLDKQPLTGRTIKKSQLEDYWGYDLRGSRSRLGELALSPEWDLTIATSRLGEAVGDRWSELGSRWLEGGKTLVAFGSYKEGVHEIVRKEGRRAEECFQYILNMIPSQGTETVRTEEAVYATLSILNTFKD